MARGGLGSAHTMHGLEGHIKGFVSFPGTSYISPSLTMLLMSVTAYGHSHREYMVLETTFIEPLQ